MKFNNSDEEVLLCKKCLEKSEYLIPLYHKNETTNDLEYECSKKHIIGINDVIKIKLDENLKMKLNCCQVHKEKFCGWNQELSKNLCFYEIGEKLSDKKDYLLYMEIYPDVLSKTEFYFKKINSLKELYNNYLQELPKAIKEIHLLENIIIITENSFNTFCIQKINNYQTIKNILYSIELLSEEDVLYSIEKKYLIHKYGNFCKEMTKKELKDIYIKEINSPINLESKTTIVPFIGENNEKYLIILLDLYYKFDISVYSFNEDKIILKKSIRNVHSIDNINFLAMEYERKIYLIFLGNKDLNFIDLFWDNSFTLNLGNLFPNINIMYCGLNDLDIFSPIKQSKSLIKINQNNILILYKEKCYVLTFNLHDNSIYKASQLEKINKAIKAKVIYFKRDNIIEEGILIISRKEEKINKKFVTYVLRINIYDNNYDEIDDFSINIKENLMKKIFINEIDYNFLNNMITILIDNKIYLINLTTKELVTIYEIPPLKEEFELLKFRAFYNYDKKNKRIEQIILIINTDTREISEFIWENKFILLKEKYKIENVIDFIPLYNPEKLNELNEDENITLEKILLKSDKYFIFY